MIPAYGKALIDMRRKGLRPPGVVYVTDSWWVAKFWQRHDRYCLVVDPKTPYDMSCLRGLRVCLQFNRPLPEVGQAILAADPRSFTLHDIRLGEFERVFN